jgi:hypothetical protein
MQRYCRPVHDFRRRPREDDDEDRGRDRSRPRGRDLFGSVSCWFDGRRRSNNADQHRGRDSRRYQDVSPRRHRISVESRSPPPSRDNPPADVRRALRELEKTKASFVGQDPQAPVFKEQSDSAARKNQMSSFSPEASVRHPML